MKFNNLCWHNSIHIHCNVVVKERIIIIIIITIFRLYNRWTDQSILHSNLPRVCVELGLMFLTLTAFAVSRSGGDCVMIR